jgi:hypothetical protein
MISCHENNFVAIAAIATQKKCITIGSIAMDTVLWQELLSQQNIAGYNKSYSITQCMWK